VTSRCPWGMLMLIRSTPRSSSHAVGPGLADVARHVASSTRVLNLRFCEVIWASYDWATSSICHALLGPSSSASNACR